MSTRRIKWSVAAGVALTAGAVLWAAGQAGPRATGGSAAAPAPAAAARSPRPIATAVAVALNEPAPNYSLRPYPPEYDVLLTRSIFSRFGRATAPPDARADRTPVQPSRSDDVRRRDAERDAGLVFRAALRQGDQFVAFVEDVSAGKTLRVVAGDMLGRGKVARITLDRLVYDVGNKQTSVELGAGLDGTMAASAATRPTSGPSGSDSGPGNGLARPAAEAAPTAAEQSILEKLRRRREQEGGK